jgi:putative glutamine amidotransferase
MTAPATNRRPRILVLEGLSGAQQCVRHAGGVPLVVSPRDVSAVCNALEEPFDALLLTGGGDVDPRLYGQKPRRRTYGVNETRDTSELLALDQAWERGVPVLGICRGAQLMAVHNGGLLRQHISGHRGTEHLVLSEPDTLFRRAIGGSAMMCVSLHHQCIRRHGRGFRVSARARDDTVEAIESVDGRCLGVQFHPEMDFWQNPGSQGIFRWLVVEAARRAHLPMPTKSTAARPKRRKRSSAIPKSTRRSRTNPVSVSWLCPECALRFDDQADRDDHVMFLHAPKPEKLFE